MSAGSRRLAVVLASVCGIVAGCLWRPKPYANDPLVRTSRGERGRTPPPPLPPAELMPEPPAGRP